MGRVWVDVGVGAVAERGRGREREGERGGGERCTGIGKAAVKVAEDSARCVLTWHVIVNALDMSSLVSSMLCLSQDYDDQNLANIVNAYSRGGAADWGEGGGGGWAGETSAAQCVLAHVAACVKQMPTHKLGPQVCVRVCVCVRETKGGRRGGGGGKSVCVCSCVRACVRACIKRGRKEETKRRCRREGAQLTL
jgi:hypothetical protein